MVRFFQEYTEPDENSSGSQVPSHRRDVNPLHPTASHTEEDKVLRPLGEDTLSQNLGIPIVVVITKVSMWKGLMEEGGGYKRIKELRNAISFSDFDRFVLYLVLCDSFLQLN